MKCIGCKKKDRPASASLDSLPFAAHPLTSYYSGMVAHMRQKSNERMTGFHMVTDNSPLPARACQDSISPSHSLQETHIPGIAEDIA